MERKEAIWKEKEVEAAKTLEAAKTAEAEKYAYWLKCVKGFGRRMQRCLYEKFQSAEEIYRQSKAQLTKVPGLKPEDVIHILEAKKQWDVEARWEQLKRQKTGFVSIENTAYPSQLRELPDAPFAVFYRGGLPAQDQLRVAIVGARMCSEYGRSIARDIARELAYYGIPVVSGMARGIDAAGHRGALDGNGKTYAIFGCGVDVCYPNYHRQLYEEILRSGGLLSEYPPGTPPLAVNFPQRNRLISAFSDVVLIMEAKQKSGSLITADLALEQGKDVYALPGRITDALSDGCNRLISQGAGIILSVEDFLKELQITTSYRKHFTKPEKKVLEKEESLVYSCFDLVPVSFEELMAETGLNIGALSHALAGLLHKRYIEEVFKNYYTRVNST